MVVELYSLFPSQNILSDVSMLRISLVIFYYIHLCQGLDETLEGVWDIQGSKHAKSVYPALLPLQILGFASKGQIALCRLLDSGTGVGRRRVLLSFET